MYIIYIFLLIFKKDKTITRVYYYTHIHTEAHTHAHTHTSAIYENYYFNICLKWAGESIYSKCIIISLKAPYF